MVPDQSCVIANYLNRLQLIAEMKGGNMEFLADKWADEMPHIARIKSAMPDFFHCGRQLSDRQVFAPTKCPGTNCRRPLVQNDGWETSAISKRPFSNRCNCDG
mmetsp:Transcript_36519/g.83291  ORF Transcript_36519/g.83291 Transcript_36519/m.83291 type:complete len:103 (-) Transcript_36519:13-321(-)